MKKGKNGKSYKEPLHPTIIRLVRTLSEGRHAIYEADLNGERFFIRKPILSEIYPVKVGNQNNTS